MRFELFVAWRYLVVRHRERFISLVGFISVFGVAVGVAALIVVLAVMEGFDNDLKEKIIGSNPHVLIENIAGASDIDQIVDKIKAHKEVAAVSRYINGQVILKAQNLTIGALLRGIDVAAEPNVTRIKDYLKKGALPEASRQILLGAELANILGVGVGSAISMVSPVDGKKYEFSICGTFACGMYDYDSNIAIVGLDDAQQIFLMPNLISGIGLKLKDAYAADSFIERLRSEHSYMYNIKSWKDLNRNLFSALKLEKMVMFIILTLIVVVACFNIASTLIMMVLQKTKDIGILKAQGATNRAIRLIFVLEGAIIGIIGTGFGIGIGVGLCELLKKYKFIQLPKEIYYIDRLPVLMQWNDTILISVAAIMMCLIATVYPAHKASQLDPVEALRYE